VKILVDTSVWSQALRRHAQAATPIVDELRALIDEGRVAIIGPIRQDCSASSVPRRRSSAWAITCGLSKTKC